MNDQHNDEPLWYQLLVKITLYSHTTFTVAVLESGGVSFSESLTRAQLQQWLLQELGEDHKDNIKKLYGKQLTPLMVASYPGSPAHKDPEHEATCMVEVYMELITAASLVQILTSMERHSRH